LDTVVRVFARRWKPFANSAETLLSPALLGQELTPEECILIADYVMNMADTEKSWGKYFRASERNSIPPSSKGVIDYQAGTVYRVQALTG
jgi:hypothetical protein